jgi:hypothetical protein
MLSICSSLVFSLQSGLSVWLISSVQPLSRFPSLARSLVHKTSQYEQTNNIKQDQIRSYQIISDHIISLRSPLLSGLHSSLFFSFALLYFCSSLFSSEIDLIQTASPAISRLYSPDQLHVIVLFSPLSPLICSVISNESSFQFFYFYFYFFFFFCFCFSPAFFASLARLEQSPNIEKKEIPNSQSASC